MNSQLILLVHNIFLDLSVRSLGDSLGGPVIRCCTFTAEGPCLPCLGTKIPQASWIGLKKKIDHSLASFRMEVHRTQMGMGV